VREAPAADGPDELTVREMAILRSLAQGLANDGQPIRIMAFISNSDGGYLSNQFLGDHRVANVENLEGAGGLGGTPLFDAQVFPGNQFFTVPEDDDFNGDYNEDGTVDAADYVAWRKLDSGNTAGYAAFVKNFGISGLGSGGGGVPEPGSILLAAIGGLIAMNFKRRNR